MEAAFPFMAGFRSGRPYLTGQTIETPRSLSGVKSVVPSLGARWVLNGQFVFHGEAATLQWDAFIGQMKGRSATTLVPIHQRYLPKDRNGRPLSSENVARLAGAQTWEGFGFKNAPITRIQTASAATLRATTLDLTLFDTTGLRPGHFFSIGARLYKVLTHIQPTLTTHRITFHPPLRAAAKVETHVEIETPVCKMRFVDDDEGQYDGAFDEIAPMPRISFEEAI
ncbi:MAG: hypothetical protein L0G27_06865 [Paracoccus sp. (in: a-proteobacteria)]|nr:hypothetical protein [Paracoccus sp. (in: a-proteobacteria)]